MMRLRKILVILSAVILVGPCLLQGVVGLLFLYGGSGHALLPVTVENHDDRWVRVSAEGIEGTTIEPCSQCTWYIPYGATETFQLQAVNAALEVVWIGQVGKNGARDVHIVIPRGAASACPCERPEEYWLEVSNTTVYIATLVLDEKELGAVQPASHVELGPFLGSRDDLENRIRISGPPEAGELRPSVSRCLSLSPRVAYSVSVRVERTITEVKTATAVARR